MLSRTVGTIGPIVTERANKPYKKNFSTLKLLLPLIIYNTTTNTTNTITMPPKSVKPLKARARPSRLLRQGPVALALPSGEPSNLARVCCL